MHTRSQKQELGAQEPRVSSLEAGSTKQTVQREFSSARTTGNRYLLTASMHLVMLLQLLYVPDKHVTTPTAIVLPPSLMATRPNAL